MNKQAAFLVVLALCALGCDAQTIQLSACDGPHPAAPPDCPEPAPIPEPTCSGQCVPLPPFGWSVPALLWYGPEFMAPECPADRAKTVAYEGHADLAPLECFGCSCKAPTAACELPSAMTAYTGQGCSGASTDFSASDPWVAMECIGTDPPLQGVMSLLVEPLIMTESGCEPEQHDIPLGGAPKWGTFARACLGNGFTMPCPDPSDYCAPTAEPPPEGFSQCVYQEGDRECPPDYPGKHVFFKDAIDLRECTDCSCGAPQGGVCSSFVSLFQGVDNCSTDIANLLSSTKVTSIDSMCLSLRGFPLGAKSRSVPGYTPGTCEPSGGEPVGSTQLMEPATFCCQE